MEIIFATNNQGKLKEMKDLLLDLDIKIFSTSEVGVNEEVKENGETFFENAYKKAFFVASRTDKHVLADDSGLCIDCLNGEPGVHTARWAGEGADDLSLINYTLEKIKGVSKKERTACFKSVLVFVFPKGGYQVFEGEVKGCLTEKPRGKNRPGLLYDFIFQPKGCDVTFAQMNDSDKNFLSHRGKAFEELRQYLFRMIG